jgi:hypothetical protein
MYIDVKSRNSLFRKVKYKDLATTTIVLVLLQVIFNYFSSKFSTPIYSTHQSYLKSTRKAYDNGLKVGLTTIKTTELMTDPASTYH